MSTRVGGVPEVLPLGDLGLKMSELEDRKDEVCGEEGMIMFAAPEEDGTHVSSSLVSGKC